MANDIFIERNWHLKYYNLKKEERGNENVESIEAAEG